MALSDCPKCWDTPCVCGHTYKNYNSKSKAQLIASAVGVPLSYELDESVYREIVEKVKTILNTSKP